MSSSIEDVRSDGGEATSAVKVCIVTNADSADVAWINQRLSDHACETIGRVDYVPLTIFLRDDQGTLCGGLLGYSIWSSVQIDSLWVEPSMRRMGHGLSLLKSAERTARVRGCKLIHVETYSPEALQFYLGAGYSMFGNLWDTDQGFSKYYLRKAV